MKIIVGLGNPTNEYKDTRHNAGFMAIDAIADRHNISVDTKKHKALIGKGIIEGEKVILAKPQTYMNLSGESVREIIDFYKCDACDLIILYDDIYLDVGKLRIRKKGSAGGHNGVKNIILHTGTDVFDRIRIGVGKKPDKYDLVDYVLGHFSNEDKVLMAGGAKDACDAVECIIRDGADKAMNKFN